MNTRRLNLVEKKPNETFRAKTKRTIAEAGSLVTDRAKLVKGYNFASKSSINSRCKVIS